jgi:Uncharacterized protein conserved in bacteria (DUF2219)
MPSSTQPTKSSRTKFAKATHRRRLTPTRRANPGAASKAGSLGKTREAWYSSRQLRLLDALRSLADEVFEIDLGVVGPGALGKQVQNDFHQLIGVGQAKGWSNQIQHEIGGVLSYERLWRFSVIGDGSNGIDVIPQAGATVGNRRSNTK